MEIFSPDWFHHDVQGTTSEQCLPFVYLKLKCPAPNKILSVYIMLLYKCVVVNLPTEEGVGRQGKLKNSVDHLYHHCSCDHDHYHARYQCHLRVCTWKLLLRPLA